ncbi:MAG: hypothetical protein KF850_22965 [Labilithrix sp.]|nr:hypothetical protein [Labilithrix sp.]
MRKSLYALTVLVVASGAAGAAVLGCSVESTGPTLNPQPLPPANPPDESDGEEARDPDSLGSGTGGDGAPDASDAGASDDAG